MSSVLKLATAARGSKQQWLAHDKPGGQAARRRLRQMRHQRKIGHCLTETVPKIGGVEVDEHGRTPAGLVVPGMEPPRAPRRRASMGGRGQ